MNKTTAKLYTVPLLLLSFILIAAGLLQGDFFSVLGKGIFICLECIGIG